MKWILSFAVAMQTALLVHGSPYWIAYEGDAFPEEVGWKRHWGDASGPYGPGADRSIEDGVFVLDSLRDDQIFDYYDVQGITDPQAGETFVATWRLSVDAASDPWDVGVSIARDTTPGLVAFGFAPDSVRIYTSAVEFPIQPDVAHDYFFRSDDMVSFDFFIDGSLLYHGEFESFTLLQSRVSFGDGVQGRRSLSRWDFVRCGVIPEPSSVVLAFSAAPIAHLIGRRTSVSCRSAKWEQRS